MLRSRRSRIPHRAVQRAVPWQFVKVPSAEDNPSAPSPFFSAPLRSQREPRTTQRCRARGEAAFGFAPRGQAAKMLRKIAVRRALLAPWHLGANKHRKAARAAGTTPPRLPLYLRASVPPSEAARLPVCPVREPLPYAERLLRVGVAA